MSTPDSLISCLSNHSCNSLPLPVIAVGESEGNVRIMGIRGLEGRQKEETIADIIFLVFTVLLWGRPVYIPLCLSSFVLLQVLILAAYLHKPTPYLQYQNTLLSFFLFRSTLLKRHTNHSAVIPFLLHSVVSFESSPAAPNQPPTLPVSPW